MIAEQLPPAFYVTLAMASKSTFNSLCPTGKFPKMDKENTLSLLVLLEKHDSGSFLCFGCGRIRPLNRDSKSNLKGNFHRRCDSFYDSLYRVRDGCQPTHSTYGHIQRSRYFETDRRLSWRPLVWGTRNRAPEITFSEGRLIMDWHFSGAARGLPIQYLESTYQIQRSIYLLQTTCYKQGRQ